MSDHQSVTLAVRPSARELAVAHRQLHVKAVVIAALVVTSYWALVFAQSPIVQKIISAVVGLVLATMFQLAHCAEPAEFPGADTPRRGSDFVAHQLRTTIDVHCRTRLGRRALHWVMGGLDFQVEHHLAPRLAHTVYPLVAERLSRVCERVAA